MRRKGTIDFNDYFTFCQNTSEIVKIQAKESSLFEQYVAFYLCAEPSETFKIKTTVPKCMLSYLCNENDVASV